VSIELRKAHARRIISSKLCSIVWQPFSADMLLQHPHYEAICSFLEQIYSALAPQGKRKVGAWQALTTEGLENMTGMTAAGATAPISRVNAFTAAVLDHLDPLVEKSKRQDLSADLHRIGTKAIELWRDAQRDTNRLRVEATLNPAAWKEWELVFEDLATPAEPADCVGTEAHLTKLAMADTTGDSSSNKEKLEKNSTLCLFPRILRDAVGAAGAPCEVYCGRGLTEDSALVCCGQQEQKVLERAVEEAKQQVYRSQMTAARGSHSRGNSVSQVPPSPIASTALQ
jgi:hypothetical protein